MKILKRLFINILGLFLIIITSCSQKESVIKNILISGSEGYYTIDSIISENEKRVEYKITKNHLIILTSDFESDKTFYYLIDLQSKKLIKKMQSPINSFVFERFDFNGDLLICSNFLKPDKIYFKSVYGNEWKVSLINGIDNPFGDISITERNRILLTDNMYGVYSFELDGKKPFYKMNEHAQHGPFNIFSIPLDKEVNLISGHFINNSTVVSYAVNNGDLVWEHSTNLTNLNLSFEAMLQPVAALNIDTAFVLAIDSDISVLNKRTGKEIYHTSVDGNIAQVFESSGKGIVFLVVNDNGNSTVSILKSINAGWEINEFYKSNLSSEMYFWSGGIIVSNKNKLFVYEKNNLTNPKVINSDLDNDLLTMIDKHTGKSYIVYNNDVLIW
jgi:hypothetical protein